MTIILNEGWHVLNLFFNANYAEWHAMDEAAQLQAQVNFFSLADEIRQQPSTQLIVQQIVSSKADLGILLITPDLVSAAKWEKQLSRNLALCGFEPAYSYLSVTERSEYLGKREDFIAGELLGRRKLLEGSPEFEEAVAGFDRHTEAYLKRRLYPELPAWEIMCFYPMSKKREGADNWYMLPFEERARLMASHAVTGRKYQGRVLQMITGSTGLDEYEWGVNLLAHNSGDIKSIVYEMRFDEVSARYGIFGDFYVGLVLPVEEILTRILG